jgi:hypothetical protein
MPEKQTFEIPQQLRELAQRNVEQAQAAYGQFMDAMAQAVSGWSSASSDTVTSEKRPLYPALRNTLPARTVAPAFTAIAGRQATAAKRDGSDFHRIPWRASVSI